jgi:hypothetical protein
MLVKIRCSKNDCFVRVGRDGQLDASAERGGVWETFELEECTDQSFTLRTRPSHPQPQKYVRAVGGGGGALIADREVANAHEKFTKLALNGCKSAIQTSNGNYWRAKNGGGGELDAKSEEQLAWEVFSIEEC